MAVALVGLLLAVLTVAVVYRGQEVARTGSGAGSGDTVAVGDSASGAAISALAPTRTEGTPPAVGLPMPEKPFPGQRTPPCREDAYDWNRACYLPSYPARRQPTTQQP